MVIGVLLENPTWLKCRDFLTVYLGKEVVRELAWVESVNRFDTVLVCESHLVGSPENFFHGDIKVEQLEIVELGCGNEVNIDLVEFHSSGSGAVTGSLVTVHPSPAGRDFETVQEIVEDGVGNFERSYLVGKSIVQDRSVCQSGNNDSRALG